jgi:hypothetical protein
VINLVIALLIVVVVGYAITDVLSRSLIAEEQAALRNAAHRRADDEGFARNRSADGEGGGPQGVDVGSEF